MDEIVQDLPEQEEVGAPQTIEAEQGEAVVDQKEKQWRELRKSKDEYEKKAREFEQKSRMQEELLQRILSQQSIPAHSQKAQEIEEDIITELSKEEYVSGEKIAKGFRKLEEKYEKKLKDIESKYQKNSYDDKLSKLKAKYSDLEMVVNLDTLKTYSEQNPEIAETWKGMDDYSIYVQAYPLIKSSGILGDKTTLRAKEVEKRLESNKKTVQSPQANRAIAQAFEYTRLSASQKEELQREMMHYASMVGGIPTIE